MRTIDEIVMRAAPERAFRFGADVERWPEWLPHYRVAQTAGAPSQVHQPRSHNRSAPVSSSRLETPLEGGLHETVQWQPPVSAIAHHSSRERPALLRNPEV